LCFYFRTNFALSRLFGFRVRSPARNRRTDRRTDRSARQVMRSMGCTQGKESPAAACRQRCLVVVPRDFLTTTRRGVCIVIYTSLARVHTTPQLNRGSAGRRELEKASTSVFPLRASRNLRASLNLARLISLPLTTGRPVSCPRHARPSCSVSGDVYKPVRTRQALSSSACPRRDRKMPWSFASGPLGNTDAVTMNIY